MISFSNPFTLKGISQALQRLGNRQAKINLAIATTVAVLGFFLLCLSPLLFLTAVLKITFGVATADSFMAWLGLFKWLLIGVTMGAITFSMLRVKMQMPSGLGLKQDKAPRLYELITEMRQSYNAPAIDRVIIHDHFSLDLVPVPRFGLPVLTTNVLYIGLPVLQCLSPSQFRGTLARRLGQYSAKSNKLSHWIYRWRQFCSQYLRSYGRQKHTIYIPMQWFFKLYTPFLNAVTVHTAREDELEADAYALSAMNDEELADMVIRYEVCANFLKQKYWPKIFNMLRNNPSKPAHTPHLNMAKVVRDGLNENEFAQMMKELMNSEPSWQDIMPDLHKRLENLGQSKLNMPPPVMETAAQRYLGDAFGAVLKLLDKQWLAKNTSSEHKVKKTQPQKQAENLNEPAQGSDRQMLTLLRDKARNGKLAGPEAVQMANLMEKVEGKAAAIVLYQQILKQDPTNAECLFAVGSILLSQNDQSGIKILERAMKLNSGCVAQGCWMLAKYFKAMGNEEQSKHYLKRAASVSAAA